MDSSRSAVEEWRLDATGGDESVGILGIGEVMGHIEWEAFQRDWQRVRLDMPAPLMMRLYNMPNTRQNLSRVRDDGRPALRWTGATCDMVIATCQDKSERREIAVFSDGQRVGTVLVLK